MEENTRHVIISISLAVCILALGTAGYVALEGWSILDACYMTVITLATVGYSEVHAISPAGRVYTIFLIITGVGYFLYVAGAVVQFMVEGRVRTIMGRRRLDKKINRLKNHYILCGYGRIGRVMYRILRGKPVDVVVIEKDQSQTPELEKKGAVYLVGDAADETVLERAGIHRAKGLIAALGDDADNVFLVLTARQVAPEISIMARANRIENSSKLKAAGADSVESPHAVGAASMANRLLRPTVTTFLDLAFTQTRGDIQMEEIAISPYSPLTNVMLKDSGIRQKYNLIIIAIKKGDGTMLFNPSFETVIKAGDTVVAVGEAENLTRLQEALNPNNEIQ